MMVTVYIVLTIAALLILELYFIQARKGPTELKIVASTVAVICILAVLVTEVVM